jgi:histidinol-phosphate aminotransferase
MYPESARAAFTQWRPGRLREDFTLDAPGAIAHLRAAQPHVVIVASPNNPTGTAVPLPHIEALAHELAGRAVLVVDEAYAEFRRPGEPSAVTLLSDHPHLAVARTMSKAFAFAGARVGYLAGSPELIECLRTVRLPYHLSALTQAAALGALEHADALQAQLAELRATRDSLAVALASMRQSNGQALRAAPSAANFILFGVFSDRHAIWQGLKDRGVLIRETGPDGWLRVSVGTPAQTEFFTDALAGVIKEAV